MDSGFEESIATVILSPQSHSLTLHNHRVFNSLYGTPVTSSRRGSRVLCVIGRAMNFIMVPCCEFKGKFFPKIMSINLTLRMLQHQHSQRLSADLPTCYS